MENKLAEFIMTASNTIINSQQNYKVSIMKTNFILSQILKSC